MVDAANQGAASGAQENQGGAQAAWHTGLDADTLGVLQNKGWDKLDPKAAIAASVKSYREAEKHFGVPPERILRAPKDANDAEAMAKIKSALGVPDSPDKYDFSAIKFKDGSTMDEASVQSVRKLASDLGLPTTAAQQLASWMAQQQDAMAEEETAEYTAKLATEKDTLTKNWGSNANANLVIAQNAAKALGVTAEDMATLEKSVGYARVMEMFRSIGARIGEDRFVVNDVGGGRREVMTRDGAAAQLQSLKNDSAWVTRLMNGDIKAMREYNDLTTIMAG